MCGYCRGLTAGHGLASAFRTGVVLTNQSDALSFGGRRGSLARQLQAKCSAEAHPSLQVATPHPYSGRALAPPPGLLSTITIVMTI
jgi:hypothetical protein